MLKEFKAFLMKGNLVDLAVAVILALAFKAVVDALIAFIFTPLIAAIVGQPDFGTLAITIGDARIAYGAFLNVVFSFVVIGFVLFLVVRAYNRVRAAEEATTKECPHCRSEIPLAATRCPACTSQLEGAST